MSWSRRWAVGLVASVVLGASGCIIHYVEDPAPAPEVASVQSTRLVVGLVTHGDRGPQQNAFDAPLHTGDRVALVVHSPSPRYLYLLNVSPDGREILLWPNEEATAVDRTVRFPESGWYQLAPPSGLEMLALVATTAPIPLDDEGLSRLKEMVHAADARRDLMKLQSATPPGFSSTGYASVGIRAPSLAIVDRSVRIDAAAGETVALIDIDHRSR